MVAILLRFGADMQDFNERGCPTRFPLKSSTGCVSSILDDVCIEASRDDLLGDFNWAEKSTFLFRSEVMFGYTLLALARGVRRFGETCSSFSKFIRIVVLFQRCE
jgi:hypothetical protein